MKKHLTDIVKRKQTIASSWLNVQTDTDIFSASKVRIIEQETDYNTCMLLESIEIQLRERTHVIICYYTMDHIFGLFYLVLMAYLVLYTPFGSVDSPLPPFSRFGFSFDI